MRGHAVQRTTSMYPTAQKPPVAEQYGRLGAVAQWVGVPARHSFQQHAIRRHAQYNQDQMLEQSDRITPGEWRAIIQLTYMF